MNSANNKEFKNYQKNKYYKINNVDNSDTNLNLNLTQNKNVLSPNLRKNSFHINQIQPNENKEGNSRKIQENSLNKLKKENKSMILSQIQLPLNSPNSPRNANNIHNFIRLNQGKNSLNKNNKNSPLNKNNQKLTENNINYTHNNTEYNLSEKLSTNISNNNDNYNTYKKSGRNSPKKVIYINKKNSTKNKNFEINVDCPEELHFFYINIFQKGNKINFEKNNNQ